MTTVAILPVPTEKGGVSYRGVAGDKHSYGSTVGEALDTRTAQLPSDETGLLVVVQSQRPDRFFDAAQQRRMAELMSQWRRVRDEGGALPLNEQLELDALIEAELVASANRAAMWQEQPAPCL
jgi:uncharacterized membrane protein YdfJ with MMPL/SSD domain